MKKQLGVAFAALLVHAAALAAPPANDNFANATPITGLTGTTTGNNSEATTEPGEPPGIGNRYQSVWFTWVAPFTGVAQFDTNVSSFDTVLYGYTGGSLNNLVLVGSDDDGGIGTASLMQFPVTAGTAYRIGVSSYSSGGDYFLNWQKIPQPGVFSLSGLSQANEKSGTLTYTVTRTGGADGSVTLDYYTNDDSATDGQDYTGVGDTLTFADGETSKSFQVPILDDAAIEGAESFYVTIDNASAGTIWNYSIFVNLQDDDHPANDNFASATAITGDTGTVSGTAINATTQPHELGNGTGQSIWFKWTAPSSGTAIFDTEGSDFETVLSAYTGPSLANLALIGTSSDNPLTFSGRGRLVFAATAGTTYQIQVDGNPQFGGTGTAELAWSMTPNGGFELTVDATRVFENLNGSLSLSIRRIGGTTGAVAVDYQVDDGRATLGADYGDTAGGTLNFADGEALKTLSIPILADTEWEGNEEFYVSLINATGGTSVLGNTLWETAMIVDDDDDPANDDFANAQLLVGSNVMATFDSTGADVDAGEPDVSGTGSGVVWFRWVAPQTGLMRLNCSVIDDYTSGYYFPSILGVYTGTSIGSLTAHRTFSSNAGVPLDQPVVGGATYYFAVAGEGYGDGSGQGNFDLDLQFAAGGAISAEDIEVSETAGTATVHFHRTNPAGYAYANVSAQDAGATLGLDYALDGGYGLVSFQPGETDATLTFPIANDSLKEGDEGIELTVDTGGEVLSSSFTVNVTILDDDDDPANDRFANAQTIAGATGNAAGTYAGAGREAGEPEHGQWTVWYRWTAPASGVAAFSIPSGNWPAGISAYTGSSLDSLAGVGYGEAGYPATFAVTAGTVYQLAVTDGYNQWGGDFSLAWSLDTNASLFSVANVSVHEPGGPAVVTVARAGAIGTAATVDYATQNGGAIAGTDFTAAAGTLSFAAGDVTKTVNVAISNDEEVEGDEQFTVELSNPSGSAALELSSAWITIMDDDDDPANNAFAAPATIAGASGSVQSSNAGADIESGEPLHGGPGERSVWFTWTAPATGEVKFDTHGSNFDTLLAAYAGSTLNGLNPLASNDESGFDSTSEISFGVTAGTAYRIAVDGYNGDGGDIVLNWSLRLPGSFEFAAADFTQTEGNTTATITVHRVAGASGPATVDYATADGSATAGADYTAASGTLFFDDGETSKTFTVPVLADAIFEQPEKVLLSLVNPTGSTGLGLAAATLTITDNDVFIPLKAGYTGLVSADAFSNAMTGGLTLKTDGKGGFTGGLTLGGAKLSFKGVFDASGTATVNIPLKGGGTAVLRLMLTAGGDQIIGTVTVGASTADVSGDRNVFGSEVPTARFAGTYTLLVSGDHAAAGSVPKGDGALTMTIGANGLAKIVGSLADGTKVSLGVPTSKAGVLPLYLALYKNAGSLSGAITLRANAGVSDGDGTVNWFKPAAAADKAFPGGFNIETSALVSRHSFVRGERVLTQLEATNGAAEFTAGLGNLPPAGLAQVINVSEANIVSLPLAPSVKLVLKFVGATGYFSGTFQTGAAAATPFQGVVFRAQGLCSGYFLGKNGAVVESGFVEVAPAE